MIRPASAFTLTSFTSIPRFSSFAISAPSTPPASLYSRLYSTMADDEGEADPPPIKFEFAASARSTCKRSGEKIGKGEARMGVGEL